VRSPDKAKALVSELRAKEALAGQATILKVDLDDLSMIRPFVQEFLALGLPLHYLINNAGVMTPTEFRPSKQGYETQFATNHLAHFLLTELLMPRLRETRRSGADVLIVILSSVGSTLCKTIDMDQCIPPPKESYNGTAEYGISKALNLFHCRELQRRCEEDGISVCAVHPGVIKTGLTREGNLDSTILYDSILFTWMHKSIPEGAATQMYCTLSPEVPKQIREDGTCFWFNSAAQRAVGVAAPGVRDDLCGKIWAVSEGLVEKFR
jgi:NAD(P)-dependent dehydrogenase (short-subunit alcohol dehydrogenase family)